MQRANTERKGQTGVHNRSARGLGLKGSGAVVAILIIASALTLHRAWGQNEGATPRVSAPSISIEGGTTAAVQSTGTSGVQTATTSGSGVPQMFSHQGVLRVNGARYTGTGYFRFALVEGSTNFNRWTNDGSALNTNSPPTNAVQISVTNGVYSVRLGEASYSPIPPSVGNYSDLRLRVWFNTTNVLPGSATQLAPDQILTSVPYALSAFNGVPLGTIVAWHKNIGTTALSRPDGWQECDGSELPADSPLKAYGATNVPNLNNTPNRLDGGGAYGSMATGYFLRGGRTSGQYQDSSFLLEQDSASNAPATLGTADEGAWGTWTDHPGYGFTPIPGFNKYNVSPKAVRPVNMTVVWIMRVK